jgi:SAM-dependent methyltransferase
MTAEDRETLISRLALSPDQVVLDVATGGGHTAAAVAGRVHRVVASDLTPEMLREALALTGEKGCRNVVFVAADAERLPFAAGAFDRITCRIAPHHFPDVRTAVAEMARAVRPDGLVGIIDSIVPEDDALDAFINEIEKIRDPSHVRSYRVEEWVTFLKTAGLTLLFASTSWKEHPFPEWVARTGQPPDVQRRVEEMFLAASPPARDYFRVTIANGRVIAYSDEKGIFVARKPW